MLQLVTAKEASKYSGRYACALYLGRGYPPRKSLGQNQYYVGQILPGGKFHVLKPDRICATGEFSSFQLVSRPWHQLSSNERSVLVEAYNCGKLVVNENEDMDAAPSRHALFRGLVDAGYLRMAEAGAYELTPLGEAETEHHIRNLSAGTSLARASGGIRINHQSLHEHEIELGRESILSVRIDGMLVRIFTLRDSGAVVRIDYDEHQRVYMSRGNEEKRYIQTYIDRAVQKLRA